MKKRLQVFYRGTVQGVGFRYTVQGIARRYPVSGYVKNLTDGRVEVTAEGDEDDLRDFLKAVEESSLGPYIEEKQIDWQEHNNEFRIFEIRF